MQKQASKKILAVLDDLFFTVKISDAAKRLGLGVEFLRDSKDVLEGAKEHPMLIILDLNCNGAQPLKIIEKLKSSPEFKGISLIGYLSHVQADLKLKAQDAGCNMVLARSAFSQNLPMILKRHAGIF